MRIWAPLTLTDGQEKTIKHRFFEGIEDYFSLGGRKVYVVPGKMVDGSQEVEFKVRPESPTKRLVLGAIKIASYMTGIIPLIALIGKLVFRMTHRFHTLPTVKVLEEGIDLSDETVAKVQSCMKSIIERKADGGVTLYRSQRKHRVFSLESVPGLIFKLKSSKNISTVGRDDSMKVRYRSMVDAKTVCRVHELGLLVIPNARLFSVDVDGENYDVIAERKLDIDAVEGMQEKNFEDYGSSLDAAIQQLAVFIAKTGFSDVEWRNIPVLNDTVDENGNGKIGLVDIEEMEGIDRGLFGGHYRRGLVNCVNAEQIDLVLEESRRQGVSVGKSAKAAKKRRLVEFESNKQLQRFYRGKGIVTGKEPIQVDINGLGLDVALQGEISVFDRVEGENLIYKKKAVTLGEVTREVVAKINEMIAEGNEEKTLKSRRLLVLNVAQGKFYDCRLLRLAQDGSVASDMKKSWLRAIIDALVEKEHLFKLNKFFGQEDSGHEYTIQA